MMTYFQFLENQSLLLLGIMLVVGTLWGFGITLGASWKEKFATVGLILMVWLFILYPAVSYTEYRDYKKNFITCEKPVAKRAGYIFHEYTCYKPVPNGSYLPVSDKISFKEDLK